MSAYPPPPPAPPPGQYPPYDRNSMRAQRQAMKDQARAMQAQARAQRDLAKQQRRSLRKSSVVGPLVILALGVMFLLAELGKISGHAVIEWYARWWPAVLIVAGLMLLAEWAIDQRTASAGHVRVLGGGVVFLLIFLALLGMSAHGIEYGMDWRDRAVSSGFMNLDHLLGNQIGTDSSLSASISPGARLAIRDPHGDVKVSGTSTDGQVHVSVHTQTYAWKEDDAKVRSERLQPVFSGEGKDMQLNVASVEGGQADLTVEIPRDAEVTIQADHGDVTVSEMHASVFITANHGNTDINGIDGGVTLHVNNSGSDVNLHSITGSVSVDGHGGDVEVSDITGDVALNGEFFGSTHVEHVNGGLRFESSRTSFSTARLDQEFSISNDSLDANGLMGPLTLKTANKNITLDRVQGAVDVINRNGSVSVTNALPLSPISIMNAHGSVDLGLPGGSGFVLVSQTRNGDMENDFGVGVVKSSETRSMRGTVAAGGPMVRISTTDGDVTVRRSEVAPLPPTPPAPPRITVGPPPPPPHAPTAPKPPKVTAAPKPPVARKNSADDGIF